MIPIVYCGNKKVFEGIVLSSISIARRTKEPIEIHLFSMNYCIDDKNGEMIELSQVESLRELLKLINKDNEVIFHDLTNEFIKAFVGGKNLDTKYTPYAFLRLFMDDTSILPYDKAIYLDVDTMCLNDISNLFDINIDNYEIAAGLDYMGKFWVNKNYCNSGVILMNLKNIRSTKLLKKCRKLIFNHWYIMPDQTALYLLTQKVLYLDRCFNEQRKPKKDTVIKHFNKGIKWLPFFHIYNIKQWEREKVHHKLKIHEFDEDYEFFDKYFKKEVLYETKKAN